jgi:hypothetical protein
MINAAIAIDILQKLSTDSQKAEDDLRAIEGDPGLIGDVAKLHGDARRILEGLVVNRRGVILKRKMRPIDHRGPADRLSDRKRTNKSNLLVVGAVAAIVIGLGVFIVGGF